MLLGLCRLQSVPVHPSSTLSCSSVGGVPVPAGSIVIPNLFAAHHDPETWHRPDEFLPGTCLPWGSLDIWAHFGHLGHCSRCLGPLPACQGI